MTLKNRIKHYYSTRAKDELIKGKSLRENLNRIWDARIENQITRFEIEKRNRKLQDYILETMEA